MVNFLKTIFYVIITDTHANINELKEGVKQRGFRMINYLVEDNLKLKYGSTSNSIEQISNELDYIEREYKKYGLTFFSVIAKKGSND